jgi:hypothetical protein
VLDKFQVRTTGPVDPVTRQPVKVIHILYHRFLHLAHFSDRAENVLVEFDSVKWSVTLSSHTALLSCSRTD